MSSVEKRSKKPAKPPSTPSAGENEDFAKLLQEARKRAEAGNPVPQSPITPQMLDDPDQGEFWRLMLEARQRAARRSDECAGESKPAPANSDCVQVD